MSNGFDEAKERRNLLQRLGDKIPGFRGFQDRELRREVDKMQREHLSREVATVKKQVRRKVQAYSDAGRIAALTQLDRLERRLDGFSQGIRFTDYGYSGFFDAVKIYEEELDKLYAFDLSLLDDLTALEADIQAIPGPDTVGPGSGEPDESARKALERLNELEEKWAQRKTMISGVVRTM